MLSSSINDVEENETEDSWKNLQKRQRFDTKIVKAKDADGKETTNLRMVGSLDKEAFDSSDDDAILAQVWGARI